MLYTTSLTIPANTSQAAFVSDDILLVPGTITRVFVHFPPGCCGLAHVVIMDKSFQLWPTSPGESLHGDTYPIEWAEDYLIRENPYQLTVRGWNLDNLYDHTVTVMLALLSGSEGWRSLMGKLVGAG